MSLRSTMYKVLKYSNDAKAVQRGTYGRRIGRRAYGKGSGRIARKIFG